MRRTIYPAILALVVLSLAACPKPDAPARRSVPQRPATNTPQPVPPAESRDSMSPETVKRVRAATVFITSWYDEGDVVDVGAATGSGFVVDPSGLIVTNRHVVECGELVWKERDGKRLLAKPVMRQLGRVTVRLNSGQPDSQEYTARVLTMFEKPFDLALLKIEAPEPLQTVELGDEANLTLTQKVWAAGFPQGQNMEQALEDLKLGRNPNGPDISIRNGEVSSLRQDESGKVKIIESTCPIEHGNSGGPLLDASGRVFGINTYLINPDRHASKSYGSLPVRHVRENLGSTLAAFDRVRQAGRVPRTLVVDSANGPFYSLSEALARHQDGDIIQLAGGTHNVDTRTELACRGLVQIRGVPGNKAIVEPLAPLTLRVHEQSCLLIQDMAFGHSGPSYKFGVELTGLGSCFLSNLECYCPLNVTESLSAHIFDCSTDQFKISSNSAALRLGSVRGATFMSSRSTIESGTVALFGCQLPGLTVSLSDAANSVSLHGCHFTGLKYPLRNELKVFGGRCFAQDCMLDIVDVHGTGRHSVLECESCCAPAGKLSVGDHSSVYLRWCLLVTHNGACVDCVGTTNSSSTAEWCTFWFPSFTSQSPIPSSKTDEQRMAETVYGIRIAPGASPAYIGCDFVCPVRSIPVSPAPNEDDFAANGNRVHMR